MITYYPEGAEYILENAKVYGTYSDTKSIMSKSGKFYIYSSIEKNNRIRITDSKDKVGKPCMASGWVNVSDLHIAI